jgi:hypothetical protein
MRPLSRRSAPVFTIVLAAGALFVTPAAAGTGDVVVTSNPSYTVPLASTGEITLNVQVAREPGVVLIVDLPGNVTPLEVVAKNLQGAPAGTCATTAKPPGVNGENLGHTLRCDLAPVDAVTVVILAKGVGRIEGVDVVVSQGSARAEAPQTVESNTGNNLTSFAVRVPVKSSAPPPAAANPCRVIKSPAVRKACTTAVATCRRRDKQQPNAARLRKCISQAVAAAKRRDR